MISSSSACFFLSSFPSPRHYEKSTPGRRRPTPIQALVLSVREDQRISSPKLASRRQREVHLTAELPYPATRLTVTQYTFVSHSPLAFALYVVGTFYDKDNIKLWETECILYHEDSRDIHIDEEEVDDGPSPPRFALTGKYRGLSQECCFQSPPIFSAFPYLPRAVTNL